MEKNPRVLTSIQNISCGLLMYKFDDSLKVLLVHPGGPFYSKKDDGFWSIPKGQPERQSDKDEEILDTAKREFEEEVGIKAKGEFLSLGSVKQKSGKAVHAFAFKGDLKKFETKSFFEMEWPPKSKKIMKFPEVDKAEFFSIEEAKIKINPAQIPFLERLQELLKN
jgi:predicted NUDIX family NTP pyrophosphohydrolase